MRADRLFAEFERLSEAPNATEHLRRFILSLAVRGKLVMQNPSDEPFAALTHDMSRVLRTEGSTSRQTESIAEAPFVLPGSWSWLSIASAAKMEMGQSPSSEHYNQSEEGMPFFQGKTDFGLIYPVPRYWCTRPTKVAQKDDILVSVRAPVGPTNIADRECCIGRGLAALRPRQFLARDFLLISLRAFEDELASQGYGTTFVAITKKQLAAFPLAIPPLAEQHRIVAKVDELMALCDQLEAAQLERERQRDWLATASLTRLASIVANDDDFRAASRFALDQISHLVARPSQLPALREALLSLAIEGRLVPQDTTDASVTDALRQTDARRAEVAAYDRRADVSSQQLLAGEYRWPIPSTWEWRAVADLVLFIDYRGKTPSKVQTGVRLITAKNVRRGFIKSEPQEFISQDEYDHWMTRGIPSAEDVLFTTEAPMGNASVIRMRERIALAQRIIDLRSYGAVDPDFLVLQLLSPQFQEILDRTATGLTAKGIKAAKLKRLPLAVPPLAEQRRIVAKLDALMTLCDELERSLVAVEAGRARLLEAALHEALAKNDVERVLTVVP